MTLTDTGPLIALIDEDDNYYHACTAALPRLPRPLITTWPCITEAAHLLGRSLGHRAQDKLLGWIENGLVTIHEQSPAEIARMRVLMDKYSDRPMDLPDASMVAAAETLGVRRIFTVDSDFRFYVLANGRTLEMVP
ncbi:MAG: PIN domain-containing protein [Armatimonadota bacterium]|nr:PIN domain-containing protein [Armatimonadota bacterium]